MRELIISLLMGAMTLTVAAQKETNVNDLSFHCRMSSDELETIYGKPSYTREYSFNSQLWYSNSPDGVVIITSNNSAEALAEGTVIGFGADFHQAVGRLIEQAGIAVSNEQADDIETKRMYEQDIAYWLKELQLAATDPERNNPTYIAQIKYELGTDHYHLDNFKEAFEWMLQSAEAGNSQAEYSVAVMYSRGDGVEQDDHAAASWYEKAANSDDPIGIYNLSFMYYNGYGVKRDYRESFRLLLDANMNQYYVQQALGEHYYYGRGVEKDIWKAAIHFNNFLDLLDNEDAETREACTKEIKAARKIIDKNSKVEVKTRRRK